MSLEANWNLLGDLVHKTLGMIEKNDIAYAEAFFTSIRTTEVTIRNSEIMTQNMVDDSGVGFRVALPRNKVGFACTNALSGKSVLEAGEKSFTAAKASSETANFALPEASEPPSVKGLFDSRVAEISPGEVVDFARRAIDAAEAFDRRVKVKDGRVLFEFGWRGIVNTLGVDFEEKETKSLIYIGGSGEQNGEVTGSCYEVAFDRTAELEPEKVGEAVGEKVVESFNPRRVKAFEGAVIFGPEAVSSQLVYVLVDALKGENAVAGSSAWTGKIGQAVATDVLSVRDNALLEKGFASRSFDDEGCSSQETVLIHEGKLESFLHSATSAKALKTEDTGNASRSSGGFDMVSMIVGKGYRSKPEIYPSNLVVQPGNKTQSELVSEIKQGVLVESMAGFPQKGSGLISARLSRAFFIKSGEIQYPIKGGMISGVAFDWLKRISGVSEDTKEFANAVVPSLRVEEARVVGA